ncbi:Type IV fimbrial biogenesis protein PilY1 [Dissulfuribacter thermophilus]|uniref:Type IV fimbrial biogenesis protein PilY1 n=1 Tax=Dissulfuribacter thermophilus TaxID=1156395 RepID=A0A1B9F314_9BACT|nr:hypothetical protein [Dissulfuribacter thermophilus]OCC14310.1 Type IV fimbrial biogenesis protein PilY1 [Dissulfuribacter thermophilus]
MKNNRLLILLVFILFFKITNNATASLNEYCATPPFLTSSIPANVLFVIDKSGSMSWFAYYDPWADASYDPTSSYNATKEYEGYFVPDKKYKLINGIWTETNDSLSCNIHHFVTSSSGSFYHILYPVGVCSGNQLNFALMTRMDLFRWAITGGRPVSCTDGDFTNPNCDPNLACTGPTCVLETINDGVWYLYFDGKWHRYDARVEVPISRINGITQIFEDLENRPRFGALFYSNGIESHKVYIGDYPDGNDADPNHPYTYLKRYINAMPPGGGTGSSIAMWEAYDYFKQQNDHRYANGFSLSTPSSLHRDPVYICDAYRSNCRPAPCMKNFVILVSDGQWNYGGDPPGWTCSIDSGGTNYSADPVVPAYRIHTETLRTMNGIPINVHDVYTLGLFLGGTGEQSLKNVAMYGSFDTSSNTWPDTLTGYPQTSCEMDDCGQGKGSACTPLPSSTPDWDSDGDGKPDTFLNAKDANTIKNSLLKFLLDIQKKTSAGSSVSILATKAKKGSIMSQAVFYPEKKFSSYKVTWPGYLNSFWFLNTKTAQNIREDTVNATYLDLTGDYIIDFLLDSSGNLLIDAYNSALNGTATTLATQYFSLDDVHKVWEAGNNLRSMSPANRKIKYAFSTSEWLEFNATNVDGNESGIQNFLGTDLSEYPSCLGSNLSQARRNLVKYIRGEDVANCRERETGSGVWKLGDIIYSTPKLINYKDYSMIFVGANDGMLHAFRVGKARNDGLSPGQIVRVCDDSSVNCTVTKLGKEEWAFIPKNVMPYLRYLADPNYCHLYFVDLSPYIIEEDTNNDGYIDKRILIGGLRLGGACGCTSTDCILPPSDTCSDPSSSECVGLSSYFALDVTDPADPKFLWEFSDPKLALTFSGPAYIKRKKTQFIMFLSGPTNYRGAAGQDLKIFVLKLNGDFSLDTVYKFDGDGKDVGFTKISELASYNRTFGGRLFTNGIDYDGNGTTDAVFFGVSQYTGTVWQGNVIGVLTGDDDPMKWDFETVFQSAREPITSKVEYMKCFDMNYIYFGTGRWFYKTDEEGQNINDTEKLYGIRIDECLLEGPGHCSLNNAHNSQDVCNELDRNAAQNVAWTIEDLEPNDGTYFKERTITDPTSSNMNLIFFTTMQPSADLCSFSGRSRLWALNCATGGNMTSSCNGQFAIKNHGGTLFLQLSRGNIEDASINEGVFSLEGGRTTGWMTGVPPESSTPLAGGSPGREGEIMLWMEK